MLQHRLPSLVTTFVALFLIQTNAQAASIDVTLCASVDILSQSPIAVMSGGGPDCASVSVSANGALPGQTLNASDWQETWIGAGGVNQTGVTIDYTAQVSWNYSIAINAGPNETAFGYVRSDALDLYFETGSGSDSWIINGQLENNMAADWFIDLYVYAEASQTTPVPLPSAAGLFAAGLGLLSLRRKSPQRQSRSQLS